MSAVRVAARPGFGLDRVHGAVAGTALTVGLLVGVFAGSLAARPVATPATQPQVAAPVAETDALSAYRSVVADINEAESRHDRRAAIRYGILLSELLTAETIGAVYQERTQLRSALAVAKAHSDSHSVAMINERLRKLCGSRTVLAYLDFCN